MITRFTVIVLAVGLVLVAGCQSENTTPDSRLTPTPDNSISFANVNGDLVDYVGDASCASCHASEYAGFQTHGMSNSFDEVGVSSRAEEYSIDPIYHEGSDFYYRPFQTDSGYFQEEYRLGRSGRKTHSATWKMEYVVGSGGAAKTFLTTDNGHLFEMPLTWYTQKEQWDFSPGYEVSNVRFERLIPDRCMACHNAYPKDVPFLEGKYDELPSGISCERCHGPGALHVDERLRDSEVLTTIDSTIVNPAHLSLDLRLDVCQQCHLNGSIDVTRQGRSAFDYLPSQSLADHRAMFISTTLEASGIKVISHADRMKQSSCFIETLATPSPLECTTCHDPHDGFRDKDYSYFTAACNSCHGQSSLISGKSESFVETHTQGANCISCHMPREEVVDVPHSSFTDHYIRVIANNLDAGLDDVPEAVTSQVELMTPIFEVDKETPAGERYRGMALITFGRQQADTSSIRKGIDLIESIGVDSSLTETDFMLGLGYLYLGDVTSAMVPLERVVRANPNSPEKLNALAQAYEAAGRARRSIERLYTRSLALQPAAADIRLNYGRYLLSVGAVDQAITEFENVIAERPRFSEGYYNLGTALLQKGDVEGGRQNLYRAIKIDPDNQEALGNLGFVHASSSALDSASYYFERAISVDSTNAVALGNLGAFYLNEGNQQLAIEVLTTAVQNDPSFADALANLSLAYFQSGDSESARIFAEKTIEVDSGNQLAIQILDAL